MLFHPAAAANAAAPDTSERNSAAPAQPTQPDASERNSAAPAQPTQPDASEGFLTRLSFHERNYFITAFGGSDAVKFQLSIKYDLWPVRARRQGGARHGVFFAFTERALWDIYDLKHSSAIASMDFQPELFYSYVQASPLDLGCNLWSGKVGIQHISNGLSGSESRSVQWAWGRLSGGCTWSSTISGLKPYLGFQLDVWSPPIHSFENPDIADTMGPVRLELTLATDSWDRESFGEGERAWFGHAEVKASVRPGALANVFSYRVEAAFSPAFPGRSPFSPYLYAQYWNGFGETLINYDRRTEEFRLGIGVY